MVDFDGAKMQVGTQMLCSMRLDTTIHQPIFSTNVCR